MDIKRPDSNQPIPAHAKKVFQGVLFDVYQWEQEMFDGSRAIFEKIKRPDTVLIFPVMPDGKIILLEEEQPGQEARVREAGGRVEKGEDVASAARRELLEETGYRAEKLVLWDARHPASKIDWVVYTFIASGLQKVGDPHPDPGEKIRLIHIDFEELLNLAVKKQKFFSEQVRNKLLEARLDPRKKKELRKIFSPD